MRLQSATNLVLHSHEAFSRSQYHLHQELEVAVPRVRVWDDLDELLRMYERRYHDQRLPFLLVEVRFSPDGHDCSLLGGGVDRPTAWLCLCLNQSGRVGAYFDDVERWVRTTDARVHLGKWCESLDASDVARMHGERFDRFRAVRASADPDGRFVNPYLERVLGPVGP
jgi:L-gulonolactone oxidase